MESYIIEFSGELSDEYRRSFLQATIKMSLILSLVVFVLVGLPIIIAGIVFDILLYALPLAGIVLFVCAAVPIAFAKGVSPKDFPVKVIIENGEIAALKPEQLSKLASEIGGIDSLNVDGYFITNVKPVSEVEKVVDYGEWYGVFFTSRHVFTNYVCQKNLINKGTIEEFEKLFEGKIQRKTDKTRN